jgi:AraC family transcriptional regulator, ethanolamine operon transcriptional activator
VRSAPIRSRTIRESLAVEDPDVMAQAMADGLRGEYLQLEARPFTGSWTTVTLDGMVLQFGREDVATVRRLRVPEDRAAVVIPIETTPLARWNARPIGSHQLIACMPGSECFAFDPGGTRFAIVSVLVPSRTAAAVGHSCGASEGSAIVTAPGVAALALHRFLSVAANSLGSLADGPRAMRAIVAEAEHLLVSCLDRAAVLTEEGDSSAARSEIVRRAEEVYRSHVGDQVSIARLSSIVGVSERSLRNAFYDVYTTSPKRYLKLWQLHQVRRELRAAHASVTDVATLHGFFELGRFAGEYKALFGEVPSMTLQKARVRHGTRTAGAA